MSFMTMLKTPPPWPSPCSEGGKKNWTARERRVTVPWHTVSHDGTSMELGKRMTLPSCGLAVAHAAVRMSLLKRSGTRGCHVVALVVTTPLWSPLTRGDGENERIANPGRRFALP